MEVLMNVEKAILLFFQDHLRAPLLNPIVTAITSLGEKGWFWLCVSALLLALPATRRRGLTCSFACAIDALLVNVFLKNVVDRPRPYELFPDVLTPLAGVRIPTDASFPSGHAALSFAVALVLFTRFPKKVGIPALLLAFLIALSRVYIGVHFPTDVIGGAACGVIAAELALLLVDKLTPKLNALDEKFPKLAAKDR